MVLSFIILFSQLQFSISLDGSAGWHCANHNKATHNPICVPNGHTRKKRCGTVKYKQCLTKQYFCQKCTRSSQSLERSSCFDDTYTTMKWFKIWTMQNFGTIGWKLINLFIFILNFYLIFLLFWWRLQYYTTFATKKNCYH